MNDILLFSVQFFSWVFDLFCCCTLITTIEELQASAVQFFIYFFPFNFIIGLFFYFIAYRISFESCYCEATILIKYYTRTHVGDAFCDCQPVTGCGTIPTVHFKRPQCLRLSTWSTSSINLHFFLTIIQYHSHFAIFCN